VGPSDELNQQTTQHPYTRVPIFFLQKKKLLCSCYKKIGEIFFEKNKINYFFCFKTNNLIKLSKILDQILFCQIIIFISKNIEKKTLGQDQTN
jgi:hypothetical protein